MSHTTTYHTASTDHVIAAMYNAPYILSARTGDRHIEHAYNDLRAVTCAVGGDYCRNFHMEREWSKFSKYLSQDLQKHFSEIAAEAIPDRDYWKAPKTELLDPAKLARLHDWLEYMNEKYGETQEVPSFFHKIEEIVEKEDPEKMKKINDFKEKQAEKRGSASGGTWVETENMRIAAAPQSAALG